MEILKTEFDNYADRIIYGRLVRLAPKNTVDHKTVPKEAQERVHDLFTAMFAKMQTNPAAASIPVIADNPCKPGYTATHQPEYVRQRNMVSEPIDLPFQVLRLFAKYGSFSSSNTLEIEINTVRKPYKYFGTSLPIFLETLERGMTFLSSFGFQFAILPDNAKRPTHVCISHDDVDLLHALGLLSSLSGDDGGHKNGFHACIFNGDYSFYIERLNKILNLGEGYLQSVFERYKERGYTVKVGNHTFNVSKNGSGCGFEFREFEQPSFAFSASALGVKAMLEDYASLDELTKRILAERCNTCKHCMFCAKGKGGAITKKIFAKNITYNNEILYLCPSYPKFAWRNNEITREAIEQVFAFNITQENYAKDWRKTKPL